jgi:glycosyltransferase involved in cell wall biosynthesis
MRLTVAICTWNRSDLLRPTLEQMTALRVPQSVSWELLVVNNNSTDATDDVIAEFTDRLPLRRLFEATPGQSNARNTAVRDAKGDYIIWTDDDVLVDADWLAAYARAFARHPEATIFGGPIDAWWDGTPPEWLVRAFPKVAGAYAALDLGDREVPLSHEHYPFGANMAFRRDAHLAQPYDPNLGLRPGSSMRGDEMAMIRALLAAGHTGWWVPDARVRHFIPKARQTLGYLQDYFAGSGRLLGRFAKDRGERKLLGRPLWLWRQAVESELRYRTRRFFAEPAVWVEDFRWARTSWAQLRWYGDRSPM